MTDFGTSFKKARESLGVSLNQIALETRISTRFLMAIEDEDFRRLPGGIFNRGFIRAYAERVGLNPDQAVADYERLAQSTDAETVSTSTAAPSSTTTPRHLYTIAAGGLLLLIAIYYIATRGANNTSVTESRPTAAVETPAPVTETAAPGKGPTIAPEVAAAEPAATSPAPITSRSPIPLGPLALELEAHEKTWVKLSSDGATVLQETLEAGATRRFTAQSSMNLTVGNAGGLTLKLNDKPVRPLGRSGQVRSLKITLDNLANIIG